MPVGARAKLVLARYGVVLAIVFAVVGLAAFGMAWQTYNDTETEVISEEIDVEEYALTGTTEAVVDAVDPVLYEPGARLENEPVYFLNESPNLTVIVEIETPNDVAVEGDARLLIEYIGVREDQVFWERTELLSVEEFSTRDDTVEIRGNVSIHSVRDRIGQTRNRVGTAGSVSASIVADVSYASDRYDGNLTAGSEIVINQRAYWLEDELSADRRESQTETRRRTIPPDPMDYLPMALLGAVMLLLAGGTLAFVRQGVDTEYLRTELARSEYAEWISRGEIPTRGEKEFVGMDSLEDLVDVAIDSNRRVIYDGNIDTYAVVEGQLVYYYTPSDEEFEDWFDV